MLEPYKVLSFVDEIDHVTIRYRQGKGLDKKHAVRLLHTHAVWAEQPVPEGLTDDDEVQLNRMLVELREKIMADFQ